MLISVCIPCYKSAKTLPRVTEEIRSEFAKHPEHQYQMVLVNDGSPDNTFGVIMELCRADKQITGVNLSRNYGQSAAKLRALHYAKGQAVVFMDDDGQHPASGIFQLIDKLNEGYDVVYAHFGNKKHKLSKRITSGMHNQLAEKMGNKPKGIHRSSFMAWSRTIVDAMMEYKSPFLSIGSFLMNLTTKYAEVEVEHRERMEGKSGYTLKKLFKMFFNIFFSFSMIPLRVSTYMGFIFSGAGFIYGIYILIRHFVHPSAVKGYASTVIIVLIMCGMIMIMLGIMGEFLGRIYMTISGLPQSNVREVINGEESDK